MEHENPYKTPESTIGTQQENVNRQWLIPDVLIGAVVLLISLWILFQSSPDWYAITIPITTIYFFTALGIFRGYAITRYLLFASGAIVIAGVSYLSYISVRAPMILTLVFYGFAFGSIFYGWYRYRNVAKTLFQKRELIIIVAATVAFVCLILFIAFIDGQSVRTLRGPVYIN